MNIVHPRIEDYLTQISPSPHPLLAEMEKIARSENFPAIGPLVGQFLHQLVLLTGSKQIFEFGSAFGYSAFWMALALPEEGRIVCTEMKPEVAERGKKFLDHGGLSRKTHFEVGDALAAFEKYPGPFDFIFCDFDKRLYPSALEKSLPKLKKGGLFVADNVLWSGWVADSHDHSPETEALREFNRKTHSDPTLVTTIVPLRDGVSLSWKR